MGSSLWKDTLREIRKSFGRFFSILMIVAIGVAFYAGIKASVPDMRNTADQYFDEGNMMDLRIVSTLGLTKDDILAIQDVEGVEGVFATYTQDVVTQVGTDQMVMKVHALPLDQMQEENNNYINRPVLVEGRLPEKSGECVIEKGEMQQLQLEVGDQITLESGTETPLSDTLSTQSYTVVGMVRSPYYLSFEKGSSNIGSGTVNYFMMIPQSDFTSEIYTEINITVANTKALNSYDDAYFEVVEKVQSALENIGVERADLRFEEVKEEARVKISDAQKEYETGKETFENEIKANEAILDQAKTELILGKAELSTQRTLTADKLAEAKTQLASGKTQLETAKKTYEEGLKTFESTKQELEIQLKELDTQVAQLQEQVKTTDEEIAKAQEQLKDPNLTALEKQLLEEKIKTLEQTKRYTETALTYVEPGKKAIQAQLDTTQLQLEQGKQTIEQQEAQLAIKEQELADGEAAAIQGFSEAETKIRTGESELATGKEALEKAKTQGQEELDIAKEKLVKAQLDIDEMAQPQWYVLDRTAHYSYMDYGSVTDRMDGIAKVFPLFFFLVAALVCLTTMTRMVDEQRSEIGTLKALGYSKNAIAFKFIAYALIASVCGSILGCCVGMYVFPLIIFNAWNLMYTLPPISFVAQPMLALTASGSVSGITILAAYFAVYKELIETPSLLMRPKAPRAGKKILLERIQWIWKRLSFSHKVTARNLFRYKKRFFMTIIGISGCTALLVGGFGIQDSIAQVVVKQYGSIFAYDSSLTYDTNASVEMKNDVKEELQQDSRIEEVMGITSISGKIVEDGDENAVTIIAPSDVSKFKDFVSLHKRGSSEELELPSDGAFISEKLSKNLHKGIDDTLLLQDSDGIEREVTIKGIVENYVGHYVYVSPSYYKQIFHIRQIDTGLIAKLNNPGGSEESALGKDYMDHEAISSVAFFAGAADSFQDTIESLDFIVVVLVICAGMLAFVVLYNLTNVNISERLREIATIKVLGFYEKEVASYVYRENVLLTIIGAGCGLVLGIGLHRLIMNLAEMENVMFGRNIDPSSFLYSFLITLFFAAVVNMVMYRKLNRIPMVESLKSIE